MLTCTAIIAASGLSYLVLVPWFYSIPILASLALAPTGIALWARSADDIGSVPRTGMVAAGSLLVALTMMCRPTFILTAVFGLILLWPQIRSREMLAVRSRHAIQASLAAIVPFLLVGGVMMWYNAARFGNPLDFGAAYNLTGFDMMQRHVSPQARLFSAALLLFAPIRFTREFPFTADVFATGAGNPWAFLIHNRDVIAEPTVGGIVALSPICLLALPAVIWLIVSCFSRGSHASSDTGGSHKRTEEVETTGVSSGTQSGMSSAVSLEKSHEMTRGMSRSCAIGITCLLLVGVIACIDGPFGVNARYVRYGMAGGHWHHVFADASGSGKSNEGTPLADRYDCGLPRAWARAASALADDNRATRSLECLESDAIRVAAGSVHALIASAAAGVTPTCARTGP